MNEIIESVKNLSIGFNSQKGKQISILRNVSTNIKKGETVGFWKKHFSTCYDGLYKTRLISS